MTATDPRCMNGFHAFDLGALVCDCGKCAATIAAANAVITTWRQRRD